MSQKFGWTLGGAFAGWLLGYYGFQANVVQNGNTQAGIRMMVSIYPAIGALVSAAFMLVYPLRESFLQTIEAELATRRAAGGKPDPNPS
jgi:GPH family glycoside/pentoside/hexuronide:cation symporter